MLSSFFLSFRLSHLLFSISPWSSHFSLSLSPSLAPPEPSLLLVAPLALSPRPPDQAAPPLSRSLFSEPLSSSRTFLSSLSSSCFLSPFFFFVVLTVRPSQPSCSFLLHICLSCSGSTWTRSSPSSSLFIVLAAPVPSPCSSVLLVSHRAPLLPNRPSLSCSPFPPVPLPFPFLLVSSLLVSVRLTRVLPLGRAHHFLFLFVFPQVHPSRSSQLGLLGKWSGSMSYPLIFRHSRSSFSPVLSALLRALLALSQLNRLFSFFGSFFFSKEETFEQGAVRHAT